MQRSQELLKARAGILLPPAVSERRNFQIQGLSLSAGWCRLQPALWEHQPYRFYGWVIFTQAFTGCPWGQGRVPKGTRIHSIQTLSTGRNKSLSSCLHFSGPWGWAFRKQKKLAGDDFIASWISTHKILVVIRPCILQCPGTTLQITAPKYLDCDKFMDLSIALDGLNGAWRRQSIMLLS